MVYDVSKVSGIGKFEYKKEEERELYLVDGRAFLVVNKNTVEVRSPAATSRMQSSRKSQ